MKKWSIAACVAAGGAALGSILVLYRMDRWMGRDLPILLAGCRRRLEEEHDAILKELDRMSCPCEFCLCTTQEEMKEGGEFRDHL